MFTRLKSLLLASAFVLLIALVSKAAVTQLVLYDNFASRNIALHRTQPGLPMKNGRCGTMTHDDKRNGTTTLFAALNVLDGTVVGECMPRHRHQEFLRFLRRLDGEFPPDLDLHLILDNYGTHKHPKVKQWLTKHRRFQLHFTSRPPAPLGSICWSAGFAKLTDKRIRRGAFFSVKELVRAIQEYRDRTQREVTEMLDKADGPWLVPETTPETSGR